MADANPKNAALFQEIVLAVLLIIQVLLHKNILIKRIQLKLICKAILWGLAAISIEIIAIIVVILLTKVSLPSVNTSRIFNIIVHNPIFIFYTVLIAPILEELVFRYSFFNLAKNLYEKLNKSVKRNTKLEWLICALGTAFIFAGLHADNTVWEYVLISILLQWLFHHYRDIRVNMITHVTFNLITILLLLLF